MVLARIAYKLSLVSLTSPWLRALELVRAERDREEGYGDLRTKSSSVHHSRDQAISRPTTLVLFPQNLQLGEGIGFHTSCLLHCSLSMLRQI